MATEARTSGIDRHSSSENQKPSDRIGMNDGLASNSAVNRDFIDKASGTADEIKHKASDVGQTIMDKASDIGHSIQDTGHNIAEKSKKSHDAICSFTKSNPTAAVLISFGLGALIARILPGR